MVEPATVATARALADLADLAEPAPDRLLDRVATALGVSDQYLAVESPIGWVYVAFGDRGVGLVWSARNEEEFRAAFRARFGSRPLRRAAAAPSGLVRALEGNATSASLRFDLDGLSPFQRAVLTKTSEIPAGEVRPYAWVAREVGQPGAVRAVGTALGRNPVPVLIPCHRVVRSDGRVGDYALGSSAKRHLLRQEGVDLEELARLAAKGARFVGSTTTSVFCLPTCHAARRIKPANRRTFRSTSEAESGGYRPCRHCRPAPESVA